MAVNAEIAVLRARIDQIDVDLMKLIVKRFNICLEIGSRKHALNIPVFQPGRITEVVARGERAAVESGLSAEFGRDLWNLLIREASALENLVLLEQTTEAL
jgi:chorismate mutase